MRNFFRIVVLLFVTTTFVSCTKNNDSTIVLIGQEEYIPYYDDWRDVIPDSLQNVVQDSLIAILRTDKLPEGYIPYNVEGDYVVNYKKRVWSNYPYWPLTVIEPPYEFSFKKQHNGVCEYTINESGNVQVVDTIYLRGSKKCFTAYFIEEKNYKQLEYNVYLKRAVLIVGEMHPSGNISHFGYATVILDMKDDSQGVITSYPAGTVFIYKAGNNFAFKKENLPTQE